MIFRILCVLLLTVPVLGGDYRSMVSTELGVTTMRKKESEKVPRSECKECKGTGKVLGGDGQTVVWRECTNCYDDGKTPDKGAVVNRRIVVVGASWCGPCQQQKAWFKSKGHPLVEKTGATYEYIDCDKDRSSLKKYGVDKLPTTILLENEKEIDRQVGFSDLTRMIQKINPQEPPKTSRKRWTPQQLRAWARGYKGGVAYVEGMSYHYHLTDPRATAHEGGPFESWQLSGLTTGELMKIHGAQHAGTLTPFGEH